MGAPCVSAVVKNREGGVNISGSLGFAWRAAFFGRVVVFTSGELFSNGLIESESWRPIVWLAIQFPFSGMSASNSTKRFGWSYSVGTVDVVLKKAPFFFTPRKGKALIPHTAK
jgi:hypothetical protein